MSPMTAAMTLSIPPIFTLPFASFKNLDRFAISLLFIAILTFLIAKSFAFFNPVFAFLRDSTFLMLGFFSIIGLIVFFILSITGLNIAFGFFTISFNWFIFDPIFLPQSNTPPFTLVARFFILPIFFDAHSVAPLYKFLPFSTVSRAKFFVLLAIFLPLFHKFLPKFITPSFIPVRPFDMFLGAFFTEDTILFLKFFTCLILFPIFDWIFLLVLRRRSPNEFGFLLGLVLFGFPGLLLGLVGLGKFGFLWKKFLILRSVSPSFFIFL